MKYTAKYLLMMALVCAAGTMQASRCEQDCEPRCEKRDCCWSSCYECGCNPLYCGAWDLQVQGGVNPITWRQRDDILGLNCLSTTPLAVFASTPKFSSLFKVPWIVGGQVGYAWSDNTRVYVEFNYSQAKGKNSIFSDCFFNCRNQHHSYSTSTNINCLMRMLVLGIIGIAGVIVFLSSLGGKVGLTHHKRINADLILASDYCKSCSAI